MLIAFHSSPFSAPLQTGIPNRGFELDVDVSFADSDSHDFAKDSGTCEFHVNASNPGKRGCPSRGPSSSHHLMIIPTEMKRASNPFESAPHDFFFSCTSCSLFVL